MSPVFSPFPQSVVCGVCTPCFWLVCYKTASPEPRSIMAYVHMQHGRFSFSLVELHPAPESSDSRLTSKSPRFLIKTLRLLSGCAKHKFGRMVFDILGEMGRACACPDVSLSFSWCWCLVRNTRPTTTFALHLRCNLLTFPSTESFGFDLKLVYKRVSKSHQSPASGVSKRTCLQFQRIQQGSNGYSDKYFLVRFCCASNSCVIFRL